MTYQSDHELKELLIKQLETQGYSKVSIANEEKIKKVFFLIDRKVLDSQTVEEFNDCVDTTNNISKLISQIEDVNSRLIVTTIQKLARLLAAE